MIEKKPEVEARTFETIISGDRGGDLTQSVLMFMLCDRENMGRKALATAVIAWRALDIRPSTSIGFLVGGYDDDPRELWHIPEVCAFVQKFCAKTQAHRHPAVEPTSRAVLYGCGADPSLKVTVNLISREESLAQSCAFFSARRDNKDD